MVPHIEQINVYMYLKRVKNKMVDFMYKWKMERSSFKLFSLCPPTKVMSEPPLLKNTLLKRVTSVKDECITFDTKFTFIDHINLMVVNVYPTYEFIYKNCRLFSNLKYLYILYSIFYNSKLEYVVDLVYLYDIHINNIEPEWYFYFLYTRQCLSWKRLGLFYYDQ